MVRTLRKTFSRVWQVGSGERSTDEILRALSPEIDQLLRLRFGIGTRRHGLVELAAHFGVTIAELRRKEARAFRSLRALGLGSAKGPLWVRSRSQRAPSLHAGYACGRRASDRTS